MTFKYFWYGLSFLILLSMGLKLASLYSGLDKPTQSGSPLAASLFNHLAKHQLLTIDADLQLKLPAQDSVLARLSKGADAADPLLDQQQHLINKLYFHPSGLRLQKQLALWNYSRRLAAVRDNRQQPNHENAWSYSDKNGLLVKTFSHLPLSFGYVTAGQLLPGFNNWRGASHLKRLQVSSEFNLQTKQRINIQLIGYLSKKERRRLTTVFKANFVQRKAKSSCKDSLNLSPSAYDINLTLPKGKTRLSFFIMPVTNYDREAVGMALAVWDDAQVLAKQTEGVCGFSPVQTIEQRLTAVVPKRCQSETEKHFQLVWNDCSLRIAGRSNHVATHRPFQILTREGEPLTTPLSADKSRPFGQATEFTRQQGLSALIGHDRYDLYSLSGLLWKASLADDATLTLTLNKRLQTLAQQALKKGLDKQLKNHNRRAAVVMLNPHTGEILAAANFPNPQANVHLWDRQAVSHLYPKNDPYRFNPWQGGTGDNAPGSTFKVVTALAALKASASNDALLSMLKGVKPADLYAKTGLSATSTSYQPPGDPAHVSLIHNYMKTQPLSVVANKGLYRSECGRSSVARGVVGLHEAARDSINSWFARLAVMMDEANLDGQTRPHLLQMANFLGFNQRDVLQNKHVSFQQYRASAHSRGDVLNTFNGEMDLADLNQQTRVPIQILAQNSIGQGVSTTPLQMAKVAASVATGQLVLPQLFKSFNTKNVLMTESKPVDAPNLPWLREAMKAVIERGSARHAFKDKLACQVYGKTGTAQVGTRDKKGNWKGKKRLSAWFMGWYEEKDKPELAFACMVTHANAGGGAVCAPIIADILAAWSEPDSLTSGSQK